MPISPLTFLKELNNSPHFYPVWIRTMVAPPKRIRKPIHLTLSEDTIHILENTGNTASRVIDRLILDAFSELKPIRVLSGETEWAR